MNELQILNRKLVMDSRDIAELTHKRHSDVLRDIRNMYNSLANAKMRSPNPLFYKDIQGKNRPYYLLTYEDTLLLLTGYSVKLRQLVIRRWIYLESIYRKERQKSIEQRNTFTNDLKDHGYDKAHQYIQTTQQMKQELSITHKKEEMTTKELKAIAASEALASLLFEDDYGYSEVNPKCVEASKIVADSVKSQRNKIA